MVSYTLSTDSSEFQWKQNYTFKMGKHELNSFNIIQICLEENAGKMADMFFPNEKSIIIFFIYRFPDPSYPFNYHIFNFFLTNKKEKFGAC